MNISSIVVRTRSEHIEEVIENLEKAGVCEVFHRDDKGQIVVVIEGEDISDEMSKLKAIQSVPRVLSAEMMYAYSEDELSQAREELGQTSDSIPEILNDDSIRAEDIRYPGHVKDV